MIERTTERELKFDVPDGFVAGIESVASAGEASVFELDATYHDTPGLSLARAGWSLRRRSGGHDAGWHLKRPTAERDARTEVGAPDAPELPPALRAEAAEVTGSHPIVPVARIQSTRTEVPLLVDGAEVALLSDDAVVATTASGTRSWREVEVELTGSQDPALLAALGAALEASGACPAAHRSKVARALAGVEVPAKLTKKASGADVLRAWIARQVGVLQSLEAGVRTDAPDAVHKSRVAIRRLRALLSTFKGLLDRSRTDALRAELRWLGEVMGASRDAEVLRENFEVLLGELGPEAVDETTRRSLAEDLQAQHASAHAALVEALDTPRAVALRAALAELVARPPLRARADRPAKDVLLPARDAVIAKVAALQAAALEEPTELDRWHEVRKAAKAVRYANEALVEALPGLAGDAKRWEAVTEAFGTLQDTAVADAVLDDLAARGVASAQAWQPLRDAERRRGEKALAQGREALAVVLPR